MKNYTIYLKTTETCNLNCLHCFTSGSSGRKIYFNAEKTTRWINDLISSNSSDDAYHIEFHGGEPFLCDIDDMIYVTEHLKGNVNYGCTSNLTFKLKEEHIKFIQTQLGNRIGTSWDPDIRFSSPKQYDLWRKNVTHLIGIGVDVKLNISVTSGTLKIEPIELMEWVKDLGVKEMALERLTMNGTALSNLHIFPTNKEQDAWFLKFHKQMVEHSARDWFFNEFFENVYDKFEKNSIKQGTFCRDCEQKIFTINADGTISGCPNSAPEFNYGSIEDTIENIMLSPTRINNIACETARNSNCYSCEVFSYCGGDCHQLEWQNNVCGAPKSLMIELASTKQKRIYLKVI